MAQNLRRAFLDKLGLIYQLIFFVSLSIIQIDQIRDGDNSFCTVRWSDTKLYEIIPQEYLRLPPSEQIQIEVTYTIVIHGTKRYATILAFGLFFFLSSSSIRFLNRFKRTLSINSSKIFQ